MKKALLGLIAVCAMSTAVSCSVAHAAGKNYARARAACLAEAGTTEQQFSQRRASLQSGAIYQQCMAGKGHTVTVLRSNGQKL